MNKKRVQTIILDNYNFNLPKFGNLGKYSPFMSKVCLITSQTVEWFNQFITHWFINVWNTLAFRKSVAFNNANFKIYIFD